MSEKPMHGYRYPESFKAKVVKEVISDGISKEEARRKYGIRGKTTVLKWVRRYGYSEVPPGIISLADMEDPKEKERELREELRQLKAKLEDAELESALYKRMLEIAEERFGIVIEKKSNTKQSKKSRK